MNKVNYFMYTFYFYVFYNRNIHIDRFIPNILPGFSELNAPVSSCPVPKTVTFPQSSMMQLCVNIKSVAPQKTENLKFLIN